MAEHDPELRRDPGRNIDEALKPADGVCTEQDDSAQPSMSSLSDTSRPGPSLLYLPTELLLHIFSFLDLSDLHALTLTCRTLHYLPQDPILHRNRLRRVPPLLTTHLVCRPPKVAIKPPVSNIYLSEMQYAAQLMDKKLAAIRLSRRLSHRPAVPELIDRGILWWEYFVYSNANGSSRSLVTRGSHEEANSTNIATSPRNIAGRRQTYSSLNTSPITPFFCRKQKSIEGRFSVDTQWSRSGLAPAIAGARRNLEKEKVKDRIRGWLGSTRRRELERRERLEREGNDTAVPDVKVIVRGYTVREERRLKSGHDHDPEPGRWGREARAWMEREVKAPTRANVSALKRFWEGISKSSTTTSTSAGSLQRATMRL